MRVKKQHADLTGVSRATRLKLREAVFNGFAKNRFGEHHQRYSHLFEMVSALNPCMRQLSYVSHLAASAEIAAAVKEKVWSQLESLAEGVVDALRAAVTPVAQDEPPAKKLKFTSSTDDDDDDGGDSFFLDSVPGEMDGDDAAAERPSQDIAREAIEEWKTATVIIFLPAVFLALTARFHYCSRSCF